MSFTIILNGILYDILNGDMTDDVDFYLAKAKQIGGPILELCCGTGRITLPIARTGLEITGLDLDHSMLAQARQKAQAEQLKLEFLEGDATVFDLKKKFRLIIVPFNSIQLFGSYEKLKSFFQCVKEHLMTDGILIFDIFNPSLDYLAPSLKKRRGDDAFIHPDTQEKVTIEYECDYDDASQINHITFYYSKPGQKDYQSEKLEQRCFFPQEINSLIELGGFRLIEKFGNFSGKSFASGDPKQILVCQFS